MALSDSPTHGKDDDALAFAEGWLREQQQFWQRFREAGDITGTQRAGQAWDEACERWWQGVADTVPTPLAAQLKSALNQTRWWMSLAGITDNGAAAPSSGTETLSPESLFAAAADAVRDAADGRDPFRDPRYLAAFRTLMDLLLEVVQQCLQRVRERLAQEGARTPHAVHAIYSQEIERHYLRAAGTDEFVRAVGELVNAHVALMPARARRNR